MEAVSTQAARLIEAIQELSLARNLDCIVEAVRHAARELTGADGATFVLRDGDQVHYLDEDAIAPLWKGKRFPLRACISGWVMLNRQAVAIEDIYADTRVPHEAYRPTFVKSLAMIPVRSIDPIAAIGNYWANPHLATAEELELLQCLADSASTALENVRLYAEMQQALKERDRQLELRDEFISAAAHELQTPLTPLNLQSQFLHRLLQAGEFRGNPQERQLERFATISRRQLRELTHRVDNMLDLSKIRLGQFALYPTADVDLNALVHHAVEHCRNDDTRIQVTIKKPVSGHWDHDRVLQALRIIIRNAMRFGEDKPIRVTADRDGSDAVISVQDSGVGIAPADQARIFSRFERASPILSYGGMGLGLFIAKQIAEAHQGTISVESEVGRGSTFTIRLPISPRFA